MRTRVAARAALFSSFSDDLRRLIGSETTRSGLLMLFEMLQVRYTMWPICVRKTTLIPIGNLFWIIMFIALNFNFQHPVLNKRIGIAILEGILELLFQDQDFKTIFHKLHSRSTRVRNELRNSQRKYADIRRWFIILVLLLFCAIFILKEPSYSPITFLILYTKMLFHHFVISFIILNCSCCTCSLMMKTTSSISRLFIYI